MVLSPNTLVVGSSYTFSLSATYSSTDGRRLQEDSSTGSSASVTILVNTPPTGGTFTVVPTEGEKNIDKAVWIIARSGEVLRSKTGNPTGIIDNLPSTMLRPRHE